MKKNKNIEKKIDGSIPSVLKSFIKNLSFSDLSTLQNSIVNGDAEYSYMLFLIEQELETRMKAANIRART